MVSERIEKLINEQIAKEQFAAQYYLAMSAYFETLDLVGLAHYFRIQCKEELMHADKMFDYLNDVGGAVILQAIPAPEQNFTDVEDVFAKALAHEKEVTKSIVTIAKAAAEECDFATSSFLQWFINEQVEEEASASLYLNKIKMVKDNPSAMYLLDQELAQRVLTTDTGSQA
ncbi:ferritin [Elizabethkingia sp. JS20170427COW]|uniref:ferritin n=1 Tax=Elizabethkingia sp. JS20170427COW TaxID=2583851 RepID=UPI001110F00A|nr:ferritin [Elizabethkingia sp. JS20170427COW]QCX53407.1 ferritin [Elizabethkingia sp. JS20170427COW]